MKAKYWHKQTISLWRTQKQKSLGCFSTRYNALQYVSCKPVLGQCTVARKWNFYCSSCFCAGKEQGEAINGNIKLPSRGGRQQEADRYGRFGFARLLWRCLLLSQMSVQRHKKKESSSNQIQKLCCSRTFLSWISAHGTSKGNVFQGFFFFVCFFGIILILIFV